MNDKVFFRPLIVFFWKIYVYVCVRCGGSFKLFHNVIPL